MEGKSRGSEGTLKVGRRFECSRLEKDLLAAAYERVLPRVAVALAGTGLSRDSQPRRGDLWSREETEGVNHIAMEGHSA
jgi:hypothetical protein